MVYSVLHFHYGKYACTYFAKVKVMQKLLNSSLHILPRADSSLCRRFMLYCISIIIGHHVPQPFFIKIVVCGSKSSGEGHIKSRTHTKCRQLPLEVVDGILHLHHGYHVPLLLVLVLLGIF